jgi:hypothetical protein
VKGSPLSFLLEAHCTRPTCMMPLEKSVALLKALHTFPYLARSRAPTA